MYALIPIISGLTCEIKESNGFLKNVCNDVHPGLTVYKCVYSDQLYWQMNPSESYFQMAVCPNDPYFYQACDKNIGGEITNNELLCGNFMCESDSFMYNVHTSYEISCLFICKNTDLNQERCAANSSTLRSGGTIPSSMICNGRCEYIGCEDEAVCNGYQYGIYCMDIHPRYGHRFKYIPPSSICDGVPDCSMREDETNCTVTEGTEEASCRHAVTGRLVPVHNYTRCTEIKKDSKTLFSSKIEEKRVYCRLSDVLSFQTNCSDPSRVGVMCKVNGYKSSVSKSLICLGDAFSACDDKIENKCFTTSSCKIHKHYMCDKENDCVDMADEKHPVCMSITNMTCIRRVGARGELPIPISWLQDGVRDCENGADEKDDLKVPKCGTGKSFRYSSTDECDNVFICRTGDLGYVVLQDLCDGLETCGNENKVCSVSSRPDDLAITVQTNDKGFTKILSHCLKGLSNLEHLDSRCITEKFIFPDENIFGVTTKTSVILPKKSLKCDYMYGEQYLYTSCTGKCASATCPLRNIPRYEVCPNQFPNRIGTIVNNQYLIFVTKSFGSVYTNRYFVCDNKIKCVEYSKVCNLVYDCEDGSDELHCINHFKCNSSGMLIPKTKECDGHIDCADLSDECDNCTKEILKEYWLKGLSWLIGLLAVVANLFIIGNSFWKLKRCRTTVALINRSLILLIAVGDFLVGCYLFVIATYDTIVFKQSYCQQQITWITSFECSLIGIFSTIGSQISLFSMAGLSLVRVHGIWNSMRIPGEITPTKSLKVVAAMILVVLTAGAIAVCPILQKFEDFFVNGVKFSDKLKIFVGTSNKQTILEVIKAYYGRTKDTMLDWKVLIQMVNGMFSHDKDYIDFTENVGQVNFFGNDGVCLFKYFVQDDDPQKLYVWSILALNFACFMFISSSYFLIGMLSLKSSESLATSQNKQQIVERNKRMNQKIAIIILTDFLCWIPFIVTCMLHSLEVINATPWYSMFSMVILPINSVINPCLYDDAIIKVIKAPLQWLLRHASSSVALQTVREMMHSTQSDAPTLTSKIGPGQALSSAESRREPKVKEVPGPAPIEEPQKAQKEVPSKSTKDAPHIATKRASRKSQKEGMGEEIKLDDIQKLPSEV